MKKKYLAFVLALVVMAGAGVAYTQNMGDLQGKMAPKLISVNDETDPIESGPSDSAVALTSQDGEVKDGTYGIEVTFDENIGGAGASNFGDDEDCFLFDQAFTTLGAMSKYKYVTFYVQSSETDVTYDSLRLAFDDDSICTAGGDDQLQMTPSNTTVNGVALTSSSKSIAAGGIADTWVKVTVDISGTVTADNTYFGFSVEDGTVDWAMTDQLVVDQVAFHN
ncbi:MAG: hypothetical protein WC846_02740 [Candidatus Gracilibacteria bacterium]|jgi:hypothetical protein